MQFKIGERLRPFSHLPNTSFVLPGSPFKVTIFPALVKIYSLYPKEKLLLTLHFSILGPLKNFTISQDLEKGSLLTWGDSPKGFFRYSLKALEAGNGIELHFDKTPKEGVHCAFEGEWNHPPINALPNTRVFLGSKNTDNTNTWSPHHTVRLSLGNSKAQDWEQIRRRQDMREIFPLWHLLGQYVPEVEGGPFVLLKECEMAIHSNKPENIIPAFNKLFLSGFQYAMVPRLRDDEWQGIAETFPNEDTSPLPILTQGAKLIRSIFIRHTDNQIDILPSLPPEFSCGKMLNIPCGDLGTIDLEWTKKTIRRINFHSKVTKELIFSFYDHEKECHIRSSYKDKGTIHPTNAPFFVKEGENYWFDNFRR